MTGSDLPLLRTSIPGPRSTAQVDILARHECPAITARRARRATALGAADDDPIVWQAALGANVNDVDGNRFVDLTSGFGVAFVGHRHPAVVASARAQSERLLHAMGDSWPDATRIALLQALAQHTPAGLDVALLGLSGSDAIDAAVKTAVLATGRSEVLCFERSYHGLALGVLPLQGYKPAFSEPFRALGAPRVRHLPFGCSGALLREALADGQVGLVLVEPIQGRGGMWPAPAGWLAELADITHATGALLALDEIQTGCGRSGDWFACDHDHVVPDLLCVGKALAGGFPLSACVGSRQVMDAWGASKGEALHTQTFLGHPIGCAAAMAVLEQIERADLCAQARSVGATLSTALSTRGFSVRGRGLMLGVPVPNALRVARQLQARGWLVLPTGAGNDALGLTPPVCLSPAQIEGFATALAEVV